MQVRPTVNLLDVLIAQHTRSLSLGRRNTLALGVHKLANGVVARATTGLQGLNDIVKSDVAGRRIGPDIDQTAGGNGVADLVLANLGVCALPSSQAS